MHVASAVVRRGPRRSDIHRLRNAGPLRLLSPRAAGDAAWIVTSNLGGGLVDGDQLALDVLVDAGATTVITTQASSKVFKGRSAQRTDVRVLGDGVAIVVPDAVVPFRGASYTQVTRVAMTAQSSLVLCDVITAGRIAYGERWSAARIDSTFELVVDDRGVVLDRLLLERDIAARMRRFDALATAVLVGPRVADLAEQQLAALGPVERRPSLVVAGSAIAGGAILRVAGERIEEVVATTRAILRAACARLGEDPWSRRW